MSLWHCPTHGLVGPMACCPAIASRASYVELPSITEPAPYIALDDDEIMTDEQAAEHEAAIRVMLLAAKHGWLQIEAAMADKEMVDFIDANDCKISGYSNTKSWQDRAAEKAKGGAYTSWHVETRERDNHFHQAPGGADFRTAMRELMRRAKERRAVESAFPTSSGQPRCGTYHYLSGWMCQLDEGHDGPCIADSGPNGTEMRVGGKLAVYAWHQPPGQPACNQRACDSNCGCAVSLNDQDGRE